MPSVAIMAGSRTYATSTPLMAPDSNPNTTTMGITVSGDVIPAGTSTVEISTVMNPASGPTDRSIPPLPDKTGSVIAIAVSTVGHSTDMDVAQLCCARQIGRAHV